MLRTMSMAMALLWTALVVSDAFLMRSCCRGLCFDSRPRLCLHTVCLSSTATTSMKQSTTMKGSSSSDSHGSGFSTEPTSSADEDRLLDQAIDSFLRGEYDRPFAEDAAAPHPGLSAGETVEEALQALRRLDHPERSHGAAVFQRFCAPLSRGDRWGGGVSKQDPWKQVMRGALTAAMLARRIRASEFSVLLDWTKLDVTDGYSLRKDLIGVPSVAFVNAALYFGGGTEPCIVQFTLRRISGVWLIETARLNKRGLFVENSKHEE